jgi:hypothetical protein
MIAYKKVSVLAIFWRLINALYAFGPIGIGVLLWVGKADVGPPVVVP